MTHKGMLFSATLLLVLVSQISAADICRALVLSNGGDKGSYQAGALQGMIQALQGKGAEWDVVTGVGAGALNAGVVGSFNKGDESAMADYLVKQWTGIKSYKDIYQNWFLGLGEGLIYKNGLYDTEPLYNFMKSRFTCQWKRKVSILATNLDLAQAEVFLADESNNCPATLQWFMASSALPVYFPYVTIGKHSYIDGGVLVNLDFGTAIKRCLDIVDSEDKIEVDVIVANSKEIAPKDTSKYKSYEMLMRYLDIAGYIDINDDLIHSKVDYPDVKFRYLIKPSETLASSATPLDFGPKGISEMIALGIKDGKAAVAAGEGVSYAQGIKEARHKLSGIRSPAKFNTTNH